MILTGAQAAYRENHGLLVRASSRRKPGQVDAVRNHGKLNCVRLQPLSEACPDGIGDTDDRIIPAIHPAIECPEQQITPPVPGAVFRRDECTWQLRGRGRYSGPELGRKKMDMHDIVPLAPEMPVEPERLQGGHE